MTKRRMTVGSAACAMLLAMGAGTSARADDLEIYITPPLDPVLANVLFVLDESGSMEWGATANETLRDTNPNQRLHQLKSALTTILNDPTSDLVNAAILGYQGRTGSCHPRPSYGCYLPKINVRSRFVSVTNNRSTLLAAVDALTHNSYTPTSTAMHDGVQWFKEGYLGNPSPIQYWCQPNHLLLLTDGEPNMNSVEHNGWGYYANDLDNDEPCDWRAETTGFNGLGGTGTPQDGLCSPDFARYAYTTDLRSGAGWDDRQYLTTHTIGFHTSDRAETFLRYVAEQGGGGFYTADNAATLTTVISGIIGDARASIPYAYNQTAIPFDPSNIATSRNDIYVPLFEPEPKAFWRGNLKKYRIHIDANGAFSLLDADDSAVLDDSRNFVETSRSLWSAGSDGDSALSGGAAARKTGTRNLYTHIPYTDAPDTLSSHALFTFADPGPGGTVNPHITNAMLGVEDDADRAGLLEWISTGHGYMGAPLHTRPEIVHYSDTEAVAYLLTSEGVLQAIDTATGDELWAYMPDELLGNIQTIRDVIEHPDQDGYSGAPVYGLDGELRIVHEDHNGNARVDEEDQALAVFGMRRGGRNYYAIDISSHDAPEFAWEIIGGAGDFTRLGQTWAEPRLLKMKLGAAPQDVLVIGGGYDPAQDEDSGARTADTLGNAVYILDAWTGQRLWWASNANADLNITAMTNAVAAGANVIDVDGDQAGDRIYLADTGGRIIRIDFFGADPDTDDPLTTGYVLADVNGTTGAADNRRFFAPPELAYFSRGGTTYIAALIGSGRRPEPVDDTAQDRFYMIKDLDPWRPQSSATALDPIPAAITENGLYDATANLAQVGDADQKADALSSLDSAAGWRIDLRNGEHALSQASVYDYKVFFTTYAGTRAENVDPCVVTSTTGQTRFYAVDLTHAAAVFAAFDGNAGNLATTDRSLTLHSPGIAPTPTLMFPSDIRVTEIDEDGNEVERIIDVDEVIVLTGLEESTRFEDRLRAVWWEEVTDDM